MVHYQAIITQLIFDHSLRIRMKSEVEGSLIGDTAAETTPTTSPNDVTESEGNVSEGDAATSVECGDGQSTSTETASVSAKGKASIKSASETIGGKTPIVQKKGKNMVGKINNLVTSDLNTLQSGQAFMQLCMTSEPLLVESDDWRLVNVVFYVPFQIILSIFVLYQLVGWRWASAFFFDYIP